MKTPYPHQLAAIQSPFDYLKLPETAERAKILGEVFYFTNKPCSKGHLSLRYASSSNCIECIEEKRDVVFLNKRGKSSVRNKNDQSLALLAFEQGKKTYISSIECPNGHKERWVTTNNCVSCDSHKSKSRAHLIKWKRINKQYGISESDVGDILKSQKYICPICNVSIAKKYHIDHCHITKKVRGLLCSRCNQGIGLLKENKDNFLRAISYLEESK